MTPLDAARRGMYVHPLDHPSLPVCAGIRTLSHDPATCTERGKHPCTKWSEESTTDVAMVTAEFAGRARNVGIDCGKSGLLVIDEDKPGALQQYAQQHGHTIPATYTVATGKGRHYYFLQNGTKLGNTPGAFKGLGIDVRGHGGYVVAAGSTHQTGAVYTAENQLDPAPLPAWIVDAIQGNADLLSTVTAPFELPEKIAAGTLNGGLGRDETLWRYACSLRGKGVQVTRAALAMQEAWKRCEQPPGDLYPIKAALEKIDRAWGYDYTPPAAQSDEAAAASSWVPVDLAPYLNGQIIRPEPTIGLARSDGLRLIYPGKEHTAIGEMESGKSWLAAASVAAELTNSKRALYIHFEEADPADTIERLQALGVPNDTIITRFVFVGPNEPVTPPRLAALLHPAPSLVVLDGVNEAMSMHGQGIREEDGVAAFRRRLVKPCTAVGAATLACDHVVKDKERRGRDPLGSIHKGNGLTGALILLENAAPFGRELRGCSHVFVTKDRPGHLRRRGRPSKLPGKTFMGSLIVDDTRTYVGRLDLAFIEPAEQTKSDTTGTRHDHDDAHMLAAVADLEARGLAASLRTIRAKATGVGKDRVDNALTRLVLDGKLVERQGPRSARLFATVAVTVAEPSPSGDAQ